MLCASCGAEVDDAATACPRCEGPALLAERYRLVAVLGRGANGITYRAERVSDGAAFAIKEIPLRTLENAKGMELFEREARVLRELDHEAIPKYEDDFVFGEGKSVALYLVQELVSGRTLEEEATDKRYDVAAVLAIVAEVADVLAYLHDRSPPVIHRDVKPKNVMRRDDGTLVLIDFGSVRDALSAGGGSTVAGTFGYMAPEQLAGKATPASDVYALGALALALLTRKEPDTLLGDDHRLDPRAHVDAPEHVLSLLDDMLQPQPVRRMKRARDVAKRAREPVEEEPKPPKPKPAKPKPVASTPKAPPRPTPERAPPEPPGANRDRERFIFVMIGLGVFGIPALAVALTLYAKSARTSAASMLPGAPEIYARPLAIDVNGDGREDMVVVSAVLRDSQDQKSADEAWVQRHGEFDGYVQAIDGTDGHVLYAVPVGDAYQWDTAPERTGARIVLAAQGDRLGIARVKPQGEIELTIHRLASGEKIDTVKLPSGTGRACLRFNQVVFAGSAAIDLSTKKFDVDDAPSCSSTSEPAVADAPIAQPTSKTGLNLPFSTETVKDSTWLVVDANKPSLTEAGPSITIDNGGPGRGLTADNGKITIERRDKKKMVVASSTLEGLGITTSNLRRLEVLETGALLLLEGEGGLVRLDANAKATWTVRLPGHTALASYTLSKTRAYLHVTHVPNGVAAVYGYTSKELVARTLVIDLETGKYIRSVPDGDPLVYLTPTTANPPAVVAIQPAPYDASLYRPLAGCTCANGDGGSVTLGMYTRSTTETAGRKVATASYALDIANGGFALPHYDEQRDRIFPPRTLEGEIAITIACSGDIVVIAGDRLMTAWSRAKKDELWTAVVPALPSGTRTSTSRDPAIACTVGRIAGDRIYLPVPNGEMSYNLADGGLVGPVAKRDAGK